MSPSLRIEIEYSGIKAVLDGEADIVRELIKDPEQLDLFLAKLASIHVSKSPGSVAAETVSGASPKTHATRFDNWTQQHQIGDELHMALSEVGGEIEIVAPINEKSNSRMQMSLGLLIGVKHLASSGEPKVPQKELIELCKKYGCYDSSNFVTHMKGKRMTIFGSLRGDSWHLTPAGLTEAATLVRGLAKK